MLKIGKYIFLLFLMFFSFYYTDKVIDFINNKDPLMMEILDVKNNYEVIPVNAIINDNTIIPGINGRMVDVEESYNNMKISGIFREDALYFVDWAPTSSLKDNREKYIIKGNSYKNNVSILCILNKNNINKLKEINDLTIFINHRDLSVDIINELDDNEIYSYGNNGVYTRESIVSDNSLIGSIGNNKSKYCLSKYKNDEVLELCYKNGMYTVIPNIIGGYYEVRNNLSNGSIILLNNLNDIDNIVRYIRSKGYNIVTLGELLQE